MRLDDFVLDLVSPLLFVLLFEGASVFVQLLSVGLDLDDALLSLTLNLLKDTYRKKNNMSATASHRVLCKVSVKVVRCKAKPRSFNR